MWIGGVPTTGDLLQPRYIAEQETGNSGNWLPELVSGMSGEINRKEDPIAIILPTLASM